MTPTPLLGRLAALAILLALGWGAYVIALEPLYGRHRLQERIIAERQDLERRYMRIGAGRPALEAERDEVGRRLSPAGLYLEAASDSLVAAELQNRAKAAVEGSGGKLTSTQILAARDEGNFRRIGIRVQMTVTIEPLQNVLYTLESAKPYLFVDNLDVRRRVQRRRRRRNQTQPEAESRLTVRFDIYGYIRNGES
jgi:general secretion pathway protein M